MFLFHLQTAKYTGKLQLFHLFKKPYLSAFLLTWRLYEDVCEKHSEVLHITVISLQVQSGKERSETKTVK